MDMLYYTFIYHVAVLMGTGQLIAVALSSQAAPHPDYVLLILMVTIHTQHTIPWYLY